MDIGQARQLKPGDIVSFPDDRGTPAGRGRVTHVSDGAAVNINGKHYLWVSLRNIGGPGGGVWPSNRFGR